MLPPADENISGFSDTDTIEAAFQLLQVLKDSRTETMVLQKEGFVQTPDRHPKDAWHKKMPQKC